MYRGRTLTLSFPPFTFWVERIIIASVVIYFLQVLLGAFLPLGGRYFELYSALHGLTPTTTTLGASGGVYGILMPCGMRYCDRKIIMFPLPFMMKAKYMVAIMIFLVIIATFQPSPGGIANFAHLGGLLFGFLYIKFLPKRGLTLGISERYFSLRNAYYRWKRRRAARKFEVYMREHNRTVEFDEHGNYIPPDDLNKKNGGSKSGWVN